MNLKSSLTLQSLILFQDKIFMTKLKSHLMIVIDFSKVLKQVKHLIVIHEF